jgi:hypothetical protein
MLTTRAFDCIMRVPVRSLASAAFDQRSGATTEPDAGREAGMNKHLLAALEVLIATLEAGSGFDHALCQYS